MAKLKLWHSGAICHHGFRATMAQVMVWCHQANPNIFDDEMHLKICANNSHFLLKTDVIYNKAAPAEPLYFQYNVMVAWFVIYSPTPHWSYDPLFLRSIGPTFRKYFAIHPIGPTIHWSHDSLVLRLIGPTRHWSYTFEPICRTIHWSYDPLIPVLRRSISHR